MMNKISRYTYFSLAYDTVERFDDGKWVTIHKANFKANGKMRFNTHLKNGDVIRVVQYNRDGFVLDINQYCVF